MYRGNEGKWGLEEDPSGCDARLRRVIAPVMEGHGWDVGGLYRAGWGLGKGRYSNSWIKLSEK